MTENTETASPCVVCGGRGRPRYVKETARYWECQACGLLYQHPLPDRLAMQRYLEQEFSGGLYREYVKARELKFVTFRERVALIRRWVSGGRLLDVGCACGYMIEVALDAGYDAYGLESAAAAVEQASPRVRPRIVCGDIDDVASKNLGPFDVVTAFDIVEHSRDPMTLLVQLRNLLRPGGLLVLTTPDSRHLLRFVMGSRWPMLQPLQHTYVFSRQGMRLALDRTGLTVARLERATKCVTLDYLTGQIEGYTPTLHRLYRVVSPLIPRALRSRPLTFNIGEMLALASRRE